MENKKPERSWTVQHRRARVISVAPTASDEALMDAQLRMSRLEEVFACPEGSVTLAALERLAASVWIQPEERIVLFNTGTGLKYPGAFPL